MAEIKKSSIAITILIISLWLLIFWRFYRRWWGRSKSFTPGLGLATHRHSLPPAQPHPEQLRSVCSSYFGKCFQYIITHRPTTEPEQLMFVILPKIRKNEEKKLIAPPMYLWSLSTFSISRYNRHPTVPITTHIWKSISHHQCLWDHYLYFQ